jgi:hypothetical protein
MSVNVKFYITGDNPNVMNKSLTQIASVDCDIKEPVNKESPEIYVSGNLIGVNYAYIAEFGRYYFVYPTGEHAVTTRLQLESDPLMSFKAGILASPAVVARNPWHFDLYVPDNNLPIEARTASAILKFPEQTKFDGRNNCYILTTIGAG